jgi:DNA-binding transcriptional regulator YdaS (Cro superfamily)
MGIETAIRAAGGQAALARLVGVKTQAVHQWLRGGTINPLNVLPIVRATGGAVRPYDLRPDIYPDPGWMPDCIPTPSPDDQEAA